MFPFLFRPPLAEPCLHLSAHTALQFRIAYLVWLYASRAPYLFGHATLCRPSSCPRHYPERWATMAAPSPYHSRGLGDPAFTAIERLACLGLPFVSLNLFSKGRPPERASAYLSELYAVPVSSSSGMLRWVRLFTTGDWNSTRLGLTSLPFGTSCTQDLRCLTLHTFRFNRFTTMLVSPLSFDARWGGCPRWSHALNHLPLWGYSMAAEAAHQIETEAWMVRGSAGPINSG
jgi:hypothetical protein